MFIKSIALEGFKRFKTRTVVSNLEGNFNVFIGGNGFGKSTIIHGICFVLGIGLNQIQVNSLKELVYKEGEAGIRTAEVSIVLDNRDRSLKTFIYKDLDELTITREIILGEKIISKYRINGIQQSNKFVRNLCIENNMDVKNPHFLVMQGGIAKVVDMRPVDVLSLVESAIGTKQYRDKRATSIAKLDELEATLLEIEDILKNVREELDELFRQVQINIDYKKIMGEIQSLEALEINFKFAQAKHQKAQAEESLKMLLDGETTNNMQINDTNKEVEELHKFLRGNMDAEKQKALESRVEQLEFSKTEAIFKYNILDERSESEKQNEDALKQNLQEKNQLLSEKQMLLEKFEEENNSLKQAKQEATTDNFAAAKKQTVEQDVELNLKLADCETKIELAKLHLKNLKSKMSAENLNAAVEINRLQDEIGRLEEALKQTKYNEAEHIQAQTEMQQLIQEQKVVTNDVQLLHTKYPNLAHDWAKIPGVFGFVFSLFQLKDSAAELAIATAAGGKLLHLVVDTDETAKALLQSGLPNKQRCNFIPLNKIIPKRISEQEIQAAKSVDSTVSPAINCIEFHSSVRAAMEFVFGDTLICPNMEVANQVVFQKGIKLRSITLAGEVFSPQGTLSGGSSPKNLLREMGAMKRQIDLPIIIANLNMKLATMKSQANSYQHLKASFANSNHRLAKARKSHYLLIQIDNKEAEYARLMDLQSHLRSQNDLLDAKIKNNKRKLQELKDALEAVTEQLSENETIIEDLRPEIENLIIDVNDTNQQLRSCQSTMDNIRMERQLVAENLNSIEESLRVTNSELENIQDATKTIQQMRQLNEHESQLQRRGLKFKHDIANEEVVIAKAAAMIQHYEDNECISDDFDMSNHNPQQTTAQLRRLKTDQSELEMLINELSPRRPNKLLDDYQALLKSTSDSSTIIKNAKEGIEALDGQYRMRRDAAIEAINAEMESVFSILVPGGNAKLESVMDESLGLLGLSVKVSFEGLWKDLRELSGGQRSLAALVLLLAIQRQRPAPFYLLDEIDESLDKDRTEDVGNMLRTYFGSSQIIAVSHQKQFSDTGNVIFQFSSTNIIEKIRP